LRVFQMLQSCHMQQHNELEPSVIYELHSEYCILNEIDFITFISIQWVSKGQHGCKWNVIHIKIPSLSDTKTDLHSHVWLKISMSPEKNILKLHFRITYYFFYIFCSYSLLQSSLFLFLCIIIFHFYFVYVTLLNVGIYPALILII
jgi:hypothetical protein